MATTESPSHLQTILQEDLLGNPLTFLKKDAKEPQDLPLDTPVNVVYLLVMCSSQRQFSMDRRHDQVWTQAALARMIKVEFEAGSNHRIECLPCGGRTQLDHQATQSTLKTGVHPWPSCLLKDRLYFEYRIEFSGDPLVYKDILAFQTFLETLLGDTERLQFCLRCVVEPNIAAGDMLRVDQSIGAMRVMNWNSCIHARQAMFSNKEHTRLTIGLLHFGYYDILELVHRAKFPDATSTLMRFLASQNQYWITPKHASLNAEHWLWPALLPKRHSLCLSNDGKDPFRWQLECLFFDAATLERMRKVPTDYRPYRATVFSSISQHRLGECVDHLYCKYNDRMTYAEYLIGFLTPKERSIDGTARDWYAADYMKLSFCQQLWSESKSQRLRRLEDVFLRILESNVGKSNVFASGKYETL